MQSILDFQYLWLEDRERMFTKHRCLEMVKQKQCCQVIQRHECLSIFHFGEMHQLASHTVQEGEKRKIGFKLELLGTG
jgi:hypothetical protein